MEMRVGELARRTGVGVSTLRAWERRFGFLAPARSASGQRLYSEDDVERVAAVCRLVGEGLTLTAAIARVVTAGSGAMVTGEGETLLLRQILQAADQGIWACQKDRTRYANRRMAQLMRCSVDELLERSWLDFIEPGELEVLKERGGLGRAGQRQKFDVRARRADSSSFVAEVSTTPLRTPQGTYEGAVAIVRDVTAQRKVEAQARFRNALLDAIGEAVIATQPDGTIVYANPAVEKLFGWKASELIGQNGLDVLPTKGGVGSSKEIHSRLLAKDHYLGEVDLTRRDGTSFVAHVTGAPVLDDDGALVGLIAVLSDSTEHRRLEQDLRSHEQQGETVALLVTRALGSTANDVDLVLVETVEATRRVLHCSQAALLDVNPRLSEFTLRVASPLIERPVTVPSGSRSFTGYCALAGKVVAVDDTRSDRRFDMHPSAGQLGIVSAIAAPVFGPSGICGVLTAGDDVPRKFDSSVAHFMQSMASVVEITLHRSAQTPDRPGISTSH